MEYFIHHLFRSKSYLETISECTPCNVCNMYLLVYTHTHANAVSNAMVCKE